MKIRLSMSRLGFTLIELVISAAVGVMILTGAYLCLAAGISSQKVIDPRVDLLQSARVSIALITADVRAACPLDKKFAFLGMHRALGVMDADNIDFATHNYTPKRPHEADYCEVSYFVQQDPTNGLLTLWRRRNPTLAIDPLSGGRREPIAKGLSGVRFDYTDGYDWYDSWGQTNSAKKTGLLAQDAANLDGLPQAVRVTLSYPEQATNAPSAIPSAREGSQAQPLVFQSVIKVELADAGNLPVAGGAASSSAKTETNPAGNTSGGPPTEGGNE